MPTDQDLLPLVYDELRTLAESFFRDQPQAHTLQPTALVHEAYVKLVDQGGIEWSSRSQFFVLAAKAMRSILVDHARGKGRLKRGGGWQKVTLEGLGKAPDGRALDLAALDDALDKLATHDERKARLVELRFFGGLTEQLAADVLEVSRATAADDWRVARAWLRRELRELDHE